MYLYIRETLIIQPENTKQLRAIMAVLRALNIKSIIKQKEEVIITDQEPLYDRKFVAKVLKGDDDIKAGRFNVIKTEDLWK